MSHDPIERARHCIDVRALVDALEQHALGAKKMTSTQVNAAIALLKKTMPDLPGTVRKLEGAEAQTHEAALKELE